MSRHTPGDWSVYRSVTCGHLRAGHNENSDPRLEWTDADIRLIDSAPDLLDACESMVLLMQSRFRRGEDKPGPMYGKLLDAVCKAHGRKPAPPESTEQTIDRLVKKACDQ